MTNLNSLTIHDILLLFPKRLSVEFALYCAKFCKPSDKASKRCIELVEKWLVDFESVTKSELESAADAAHSTAYSAAYSAASEKELKLYLINMIEEKYTELILMEVT